MDKRIKLSVNNLKVSFRTDGGKVQAVRDINFDLYEGETLAIVGESGSGKSVTSKAIMGISAVNAIHEGGEILYDGQDLLRIPEEEMHKLRGDKIAMIFQDPLSSLNPIMRIGRQITEAMLLKNKANRKEGRESFNSLLATLSGLIKEALAATGNTGVSNEEVDNYIKTFDNFNIQAIKLDNSYTAARTAAEEMIAIIEEFLFLAEKKQKVDVMATLNLVGRKLADMHDKYFAAKYEEALLANATALNEAKVAEREKKAEDTVAEPEVVATKQVEGEDAPAAQTAASESEKATGTKRIKQTLAAALDSVKRAIGINAAKKEASAQTIHTLTAIRETASAMLAEEKYDFFRIGYYIYKNPDQDLSRMPAAEANEMAYHYLVDNFMNRFLELEKIAVEYSFKKTMENKKNAIDSLQNAVNFFLSGNFTAQDATAVCKNVTKDVLSAIDPLAVIKDNVAYTFGGALEREVEKYFFYIKNNPKEEERFARQTAKREALLAKGKNVDWKVVPKSIIEPEVQIREVVSVINRVIDRFRADLENAQSFDADKRCVEIIDYLKAKASQVVYVLTPRIAKEKAIKLMEEVGIPEARMRFRQYPFEFSGGMRQRIVIAIALSANPDILICDEPTTALDVTIQAQILELINKLKRERELSIIFITHDLGVVANMADRIAVMYAGKIVEYGTANEVFYNPQHPYTWALLSSMPDLDTNEKLDAIPGTPPNMIYPPVGDAFAERNKYAMEIDFEMQPPMFEVSPTHYAATWLLHPDAPKVEIPKIITERIKRMKERGGNYGEE